MIPLIAALVLALVFAGVMTRNVNDGFFAAFLNYKLVPFLFLGLFVLFAVITSGG